MSPYDRRATSSPSLSGLLVVSGSLGARPLQGGAAEFVVWAPRASRVEVHLLADDRYVELVRDGRGYHAGRIDDVEVGALYRYRLDGGRELADPCSRSQPDGVHGPSALVDLSGYLWHDAGFVPPPLEQLVIYELHVGTFTGDGTLDAAIDDLDHLVELGVNAVEVMPVAQFPGRRNWGYDGVFAFAVQDSYGGPAALKRFVDASHRRG